MSEPAEIWECDPKQRIAELLDELMSVAGPAGIGDVELAGYVIGAKEGNDLDVALGKEDLAGHRWTLMNALDAIADSDERDRAYDALYRVINATFRIARSLDPLNEMQRAEKKQMAMMKTQKEKNLAARDKIVLTVVDEDKITTGGKQRPSAARLLSRVNERLAAADEEKIGWRQYYRIVGKRRPEK